MLRQLKGRKFLSVFHTIMKYQTYIIKSIRKEAEETFILQVIPADKFSILSFKPGQYGTIKNPTYHHPDEEHTFSFASSPNTKEYLEFCIKVYGQWTKILVEKHSGEELYIAGPFGNFIWNKPTDRNAVFLVGGVGIAPIISILRYIDDNTDIGNYILIYGNRTPQFIAYRNEMSTLTKNIRTLKVVDIFSHLDSSDSWQGYRGFVNEDILRNEVDFSIKPTFFVIGPPVFLQKMEMLLKQFGIKENKIKQEKI